MTKPNWNMLAMAAFLLCALASRYVAHVPVQQIVLPQLQTETQKVQLKELLPRAPASVIENTDGRDFIYKTLASNLPAAYQVRAHVIAHTIIEEANKNGLDPIFLLAVIKTESRFNPLAKGRHGDLGMMQLLPKTGYWMAARIKLQGKVDLRDPVTNIKIGAAYFAHLRKHFGPVGTRYLAAYNMGIRNVHKLLKESKEPVIYANRVLKNYSALYLQWSASLPSEKRTIAAN